MFESLVNTEGFQTSYLFSQHALAFESLVNTEGFQTHKSRGPAGSMFVIARGGCQNAFLWNNGASYIVPFLKIGNDGFV